MGLGSPASRSPGRAHHPDRRRLGGHDHPPELPVPISTDEAVRRLRQGAGAQFDRDLVAKFLDKREEIVS
jgi:hypothetical protein